MWAKEWQSCLTYEVMFFLKMHCDLLCQACAILTSLSQNKLFPIKLGCVISEIEKLKTWVGGNPAYLNAGAAHLQWECVTPSGNMLKTSLSKPVGGGACL